MTELVTTNTLKMFIATSLNSIKVKEDILYQMCYGLSEAQFQSQLKEYHCEGCKTPEELCKRLWGLMTDPNQWEENEKFVLGNEWNHHFSVKNKVIKYEEIDVDGNVNKTLLNKYNDVELLEKCIYREFNHAGVFVDTYRVEMITTPEDKEVIVWNLYRD